MYAAMKMLERKLLYVLIAVPWFFLLHIVLFIKLERIFFEDYSKHFSDRNKKRSGFSPLSFQFKVDRLQIILAAKKYISTCRNCS